MTFSVLPELGTVNVSRQVQVFWNSTESPGENDELLTLAMVCHGVDMLVPLFELAPLQST
jgi:hypothetical protein